MYTILAHMQNKAKYRKIITVIGYFVTSNELKILVDKLTEGCVFSHTLYSLKLLMQYGI